ncbi:MAG: DUF2461 domain-containing protein [Spirochaetota bacterium]
MIRKETFEFLEKLKKNNSREWFNANRELYNDAYWNISDLAFYLIGGIRSFDATVEGVEPKDCIFRLMRDTRFAADKTPYKTNFGIFIKQNGRRSPGAGYYLHIEPGNCLVSGGIYMPPSAQLSAIRAELARDPDTMRAILRNPALKKEFGFLTGETVKTAPRGYAKDHPALDLLKFKNYCVGRNLPDSAVITEKFPESCLRSFRVLRDFNQYLNRIMNR